MSNIETVSPTAVIFPTNGTDVDTQIDRTENQLRDLGEVVRGHIEAPIIPM